MLILAIILSLLFILCDCGSITCGENQCSGKIINCTDGSACFVTCSINGCDSAIINCVDGYDCSISTDGASAAKSSTINGNLATKLHVNTSSTGDFQLQNAHIYCPIHGECNIYCKGDTSEVCGGIDIHAESCTAFTLRCEQYNSACYQVHVWCPKYNTCILIGEPSSTAAMTQMEIYSVQGFNTVTVEKGNTGISIGTMYCMSNYSSSCLIDGTDNTQCSTSHICDNPPLLTTTGSPTTTIPTTTIPTTTIPTTLNPTTKQPTTSMPTTSVPTTSIPTTSVPTTSMPTTSVPTTSIPTTSVPTTSSPSLFPTLPRSHEISEVLSTLDQSHNGEQDNEKLSDNLYMIMIGAILALLICIICVLVGIVWRKKLKNKAVTIIETNLSVETVNVEMAKNTNKNEQKSENVDENHEMNIVAEGDYKESIEPKLGIEGQEIDNRLSVNEILEEKDGEIEMNDIDAKQEVQMHEGSASDERVYPEPTEWDKVPQSVRWKNDVKALPTKRGDSIRMDHVDLVAMLTSTDNETADVSGGTTVGNVDNNINNTNVTKKTNTTYQGYDDDNTPF